MSTNDELKNKTANGTKPVLSAALLSELLTLNKIKWN
jgi:hypothetical protein